MKFVICILAVLTSSYAAKFDFKGSLKCDSKERWCYTLEGSEVDLISNDYIVDHKDCIGPRSYAEDVDFDLSGHVKDDGYLDNYFEIALLVIHNCTGTKQYIEEDYEEVPITQNVHHTMNKKFDLNTNKVIPQ